MKRIWYTFVIAVGITALCIYQYTTVSRTTKHMEDDIDVMLTAVENGDAQTAVKYIEEMEQEWDRSLKVINCFITHENTDKISERLSEVSALVRYGDSKELKSGVQRLKLSLRILREGEQPKLENLL